MEEVEAIALTPSFFMVFPIIGILTVLIALAMQVLRNRSLGMRIGMGTYVMSALVVGILAFLAAWCAQGLVDATDLIWIQTCLVLTLTGVLLPNRDVFQARMDAFASKGIPHDFLAVALRVVRDAAIILVAAFCARNALEVTWNDTARELSGQSVAIEYTFIALMMAVTFLVGQRTAVGPIIVALSCAFTGIAQSFILRFKEAPILPSDLLALQTANEVADQYTYTLTDANIRGVLYVGLALLALCFLRPVRPKSKNRLIATVILNIILALPLALSLDWWLEVPDYREDFGYDIYYFRAARAYKSQGFIPTFMTAVQDLAIEEPAGYSTERAQELMERYARNTDEKPERSARYAQAQTQFDQMQPSVVVVMNETFADLSLLDELHCGYTGPGFFKGMDDTLSRGNLGVSVYGAGTCNTEFEMLTGNSLAYVGSGKYPYQMYDFNEVDNLARQFSSIGYETTAIHPNLKSNWNRSKVYGEMGFDSFMSIDDFPPKSPGLHAGVTDKTTYEMVLDQLESSDDPQFIFDVTMQNHGGYDFSKIPADKMVNYNPDGFSDEDKAKLNVFLSCINASDDDLAWFVDQLRELDRPVVLVFFGDHHPVVSNLYNDAFFPNEDEIVHQERVYQTSYIVWANYDVAGNAQVSQTEDVGTDCLGALTLDLIGAPLSDFQKAQLSIHDRLSIINSVGYKAANGTWHAAGTAPYLDTTYRDMGLISHLTFGSKFV